MAEFDLIEKYFAPLSMDGLKNDTAVLDIPAGHQLVVSSDTSNRGDHFVEEMSAFDAGRKCLRSNVSDLVSSGADPLAYQLNLALPKDLDEDWLAGFADGLAADQALYNIALSGGDTTGMRAGGLSVSITAMGLVPTGRAVLRSGARAGDVVVITGILGDAYLSRLHMPSPPVVLAPLVRKYAKAAVDISDGILADLGHICSVSGLGARLEFDKIPLSDKGRAALRDGKASSEDLLTWGEDYELAMAVSPSDVEAFQKQAGALGVALSVVGVFEAVAGVKVFDQDGHEMSFSKTGWQHF
ncbi:MAG TPA: thiamine-phosphate kinase [Alphaproteobacteria bacterium]|nr:thiamine-phosphate kinase [Alphaproteobacteria bacterium]USO05824.1 MAG: thiamine-phosphate kinase [Rhodospirillales bacterium]HOO82859.1 thiamine-phosphate kinase [Alphaproteobacteria bacterium]